MPSQIMKRDGRLETWSTDRIAQAIFKALAASGIKDPLLGKRLAKKVEKKLDGIDIPEQEHVQNMVEQILMESRQFEIAKKYILYREKRRQLRSQKAAYLDIKDVIDTYLDQADWRVNENANMTHSFQGLMLHLSGTVQARYALEKYPEEIRLAHEHGYFHIHDLSFGLAGYCAGWSLRDLLLEDSTCATVVRPPRPITLTRPAARWSTFWARSRTNGRAPRPSTTWTPTWPRSSATTG